MRLIEYGDERLPPRFWAKVHVHENGCWVWTAYRVRDGYGQVHVRNDRDPLTNKLVKVGALAHRHAYETLVHSVPKGTELDHRCRVRACVNPTHLEPVSHLVNVRRGRVGEAARERQLAKRRCKRGHRFAGRNLRIKRNGSRGCRTCERDRQRLIRLLDAALKLRVTSLDRFGNLR